jgi:alpha-beta hydrolase superfamily lysophospholipase
MRGSLRRLLIIASGTVAIVVLVCLAVAAYVGWRMTHPARSYASATPASIGLAYTNVTFRSRIDDIRLSGWYIPAGRSEKTIIVVDGYAAHRLSESAAMPVVAVLVRHGFNVLTFDQRGCGSSGGDLVTLGLDEPRDVLGAVDWVRSHGGRQVQIGILAYSLGATTALEAGAQDNAGIRAIVADSALAQLYPYIVEHADRWTGLPSFPFNRLIAWITPVITGMDAHKVDALAAVHTMPRTALLFIAGTDDRTISDSNSVELFQAAATRAKALWLVPGADHVESYNQQPQRYEQRVLAFFQRYL